MAKGFSRRLEARALGASFSLVSIPVFGQPCRSGENLLDPTFG
jgi:hypothetical protein